MAKSKLTLAQFFHHVEFVKACSLQLYYLLNILLINNLLTAEKAQVRAVLIGNFHSREVYH